ncbi:MAG: DUF4832 domain-containing protein [Herpetosiphonaceae bacterium]|nr:DUF4832 domain-containing protein [Herpetosiphonaceae bacterium]
MRRGYRIWIFLGLLALAGCGPPATVPEPLFTLTPTHISYAAAEIANPGRGLYRWREQTMICPPEFKSDRDAYNRWTWAALEPAQGAYTWASVRQFIEAAAARGQRAWIGFGTSTGPLKAAPYLPAYMHQPGWGAEFDGEWYPDYNSAAVQARLVALLDAFVAEFGDDERIAGIQMLSYGRYGEGYLPWNAPHDHPMWISDASAAWLVEAWHSRLSDTYQLSVGLGENPVFYHAMARQPLWGWFRNAFGWPEQMQNIDKIMSSDVEVNGVAIGPAVRDRWQFAPVFTEAIGEGGALDYTQQFSAVQTQVISYHISLISNGNFAAPYKEGPWNFWPAGEECPEQPSAWRREDLAAYIAAGKHAGYRYYPLRIGHTEARPGEAFSITTNWYNEGVAPIYEPWQVFFQLRRDDAERSVIWEAQSGVDLRSILPTEPYRPVSVKDTFQLPASLPAATYRLHMLIPALNTYVAPLQLAIEGQQADGSYDLGRIAVRCDTNGEACP